MEHIKIDDIDLGEMLHNTFMSRDAGFKTIQCDADVMIRLLMELRGLRAARSLATVSLNDVVQADPGQW